MVDVDLGVSIYSGLQQQKTTATTTAKTTATTTATTNSAAVGQRKQHKHKNRCPYPIHAMGVL